ncbi:MAG TPA: DUF4476 domain-containing protein [Niabella sp.]|mgnify:CR=1 FL=1|nr:DUF4476 domain-containing protein [Niabella sp.]HOZ98422.1 DUF4476 domain-containing protein [Niabella sp.]HQW16045.1 DUF4476 domain-containing protein [Niabella sp.]HQX21203.1 DUF4476 domain-containing protein [Niabella sp.]HQX42831.1 DUF4476 domain-containing protein [Niabella sp.]
MSRHFLFSAVLLLLSFVSFGQYQVQSKYFVYLQTEPAQPFYIKINSQQISANASGYLILPQLKDGDYKLVVGFPQDKAPEQTFKFKIDSKDKGYLIKDYGTDGWGLFDLQTMAVQKAKNTPEKVEEVAVNTTPKVEIKPKTEEKPKQEEKKAVVADDGVSDFTKVLAQAANDPSLLEKPKPEPVEEKPVAVKPNPEPQKEVATGQPPVSQPEVAKQPVAVSKVEASSVKSNIITQSQSPDGLTVVYEHLNAGGQVDPITIFIPAPHPQQENGVTNNVENKALSVVIPPGTTNPIEVSTSAEDAAKNKIERKIQGIVTPSEKTNKIEATTSSESPIGSNSTVAKAEKPSTNALAEKLPVHCKAVASEDDFLKLRRSMANETNDDNMITQAKLAFDTRCYSTSQIKYLSSMFLSNAGKFHFYEAAKGHVSDIENFASLASELKDQTYKDKFNTLLQQ